MTDSTIAEECNYDFDASEKDKRIFALLDEDKANGVGQEADRLYFEEWPGCEFYARALTPNELDIAELTGELQDDDEGAMWTAVWHLGEGCFVRKQFFTDDPLEDVPEDINENIAREVHGAPAWLSDEPSSRSEFAERIKRLGGMYSPSGCWIDISKLNMKGFETEEEEQEIEAKPEENIHHNIEAHSGLVLVRATDVIVRQKEWLWEGHLLRGGLELLTGQPGLGKSQVQIHLMACATARKEWPDHAPAIEPVNVIMVTAEDAIDTEVVPRLMAAGADLERIHILKCIKTDKQHRQFLLAEDLVRLQWTITQVGNVGLVCIDPITAYMGGKMDSHKATEVRSQLGPLKDFSEHSNIALSAITHPAKNAGTKAIDHFIGSQAFVAAARVGHACFEEIEEDEDGEKYPTGRILFTNVKHNAHRKMPTLAFRIESHFIYPEPFHPIESSYVVWDDEPVDISADQAVAAARGKAKKEEASVEVKAFLCTMLDAGGGSCKQTDVAEQAEALGYSDKELRTAREKCHIVSKRHGGIGPEGYWVWAWEGGERPVFD
jgi:AAA domain